MLPQDPAGLRKAGITGRDAAGHWTEVGSGVVVEDVSSTDGVGQADEGEEGVGALRRQGRASGRRRIPIAITITIDIAVPVFTRLLIPVGAAPDRLGEHGPELPGLQVPLLEPEAALGLPGLGGRWAQARQLWRPPDGEHPPARGPGGRPSHRVRRQPLPRTVQQGHRHGAQVLPQPDEPEEGVAGAAGAGGPPSAPAAPPRVSWICHGGGRRGWGGGRCSGVLGLDGFLMADMLCRVRILLASSSILR